MQLVPGEARLLPGKRRMTDVIDREETNRDGSSRWPGSLTETEAAANSTQVGAGHKEEIDLDHSRKQTSFALGVCLSACLCPFHCRACASHTPARPSATSTMCYALSSQPLPRATIRAGCTRCCQSLASHPCASAFLQLVSIHLREYCLGTPPLLMCLRGIATRRVSQGVLHTYTRCASRYSCLRCTHS